MREVTLTEILDAREMRASVQKELLEKYKKTLICFTMNIAGPVKVTPLIERAFKEGISLLKKIENIVFEKSEILHTGCTFMMVAVQSPESLKSICTEIEESHPLGRLFDMDVITAEGTKLERENQRSCLICGKIGRECSAGRIHSADELFKKTNEILLTYFVEKDAKKISELAKESLLFEVSTTPKPGLVDKNNSGSHKDMNFETFLKSTDAIYTYFGKCFKAGFEKKSFEEIRSLGKEAEKLMLDATGGINTHKGIIYSLGIICTALGTLYDGILTLPENLSEICSRLVEASVKKDFENISPDTAGGRLYLKHGIKGIRGEAESGFKTIFNLSLPVFEECINNGSSLNDSGVFTLLKLIAETTDTNILNRGGFDGASFASKGAKDALEKDLSFANELDKEFIKRNLSPGGCADLLCATYFLYKLKRG